MDNDPIEIIEDFPDVPLLCGRGSYLMMAFIAAGYRGIQLKRLNNMRMAMEVVTVVDFVTLDGRRITQRAIALKRGNSLRDHYDWPRSKTFTKISLDHHMGRQKCMRQGIQPTSTKVEPPPVVEDLPPEAPKTNINRTHQVGAILFNFD